MGQVQWLRDGFGLGLGTEFEGFPRYKVMRNQGLGETCIFNTCFGDSFAVVVVVVVVINSNNMGFC